MIGSLGEESKALFKMRLVSLDYCMEPPVPGPDRSPHGAGASKLDRPCNVDAPPPRLPLPLRRGRCNPVGLVAHGRAVRSQRGNLGSIERVMEPTQSDNLPSRTPTTMLLSGAGAGWKKQRDLKARAATNRCSVCRRRSRSSGSTLPASLTSAQFFCTRRFDA